MVVCLMNLEAEGPRHPAQLGDERMVIPKENQAYVPAREGVHEGVVHDAGDREGVDVGDAAGSFGDPALREAIEGDRGSELNRVRVGGAGDNAQLHVGSREDDRPLANQVGHPAQHRLDFATLPGNVVGPGLDEEDLASVDGSGQNDRRRDQDG